MVLAEVLLKKLFGKAVAKSSKKSIIKNIDIDDFEVVTYGKNFNSEVSKVIVNTVSDCEAEGGFIISEIVAKSLPKTDQGTPVLQIEALSIKFKHGHTLWKNS